MKKLFILIILLNCTLLFAEQKADEKDKQKETVPGGTAVVSVVGELQKKEEGTVMFEYEEDVNTPYLTIKAGRDFELLKSSILEKIEYDIEKRQTERIKLWGKFTEFEDENYIFPIYFLAVKQQEPNDLNSENIEDANVSDTNEADANEAEVNEPARPGFNDTNDVLSVPDEVLNEIKKRPVIKTRQLVEDIKLEEDYVLSDRTGFIRKRESGQYVFDVDMLGMSISKVKLGLLKSEALENAIDIQEDRLSKIRFRAAGIVTEYKRKKYLLLERAVRTFDYGNF